MFQGSGVATPLRQLAKISEWIFRHRNTDGGKSLQNRVPISFLFKTNGVLPSLFIWMEKIDPIHMRQNTELSYFCRASLFCGAALNIRKLQLRWLIFNFFQMTEDGKTPFILKMKAIRFSILKICVPSFTYFLKNIVKDFRELPQRGRHIHLMELLISGYLTKYNYTLWTL